MSVSTLTDVLSSDAPAPGGGAAAGVITALAAALAGMAGRFTVKGRDVADGDAEKFTALVSRADERRIRAQHIADADARVYSDYVAAARLPAGPDGEPRVSAKVQARDAAIAVPLELAEVAREIAEIGLRLVESGNPRLRSDACAAALFASAAATLSAILVGENLAAEEFDDRLAQANQHAVAARAAANEAMAAFPFLR
ncbi:cyclodeaminase/cyclohydrolase family protein [Mycobacterium sp. BMJ-28]